MTKLKLLAAAAVISGLIATPVIASDQMNSRTQEYRADTVDNGYRRDTGFWPGDVAADAVGGAIGIAGTAGAVASAPFRNSYNSYDGYNGVPRDSYAQRMGFVCQPDTWFRGEDGRRHICQ